MTMMDGQVQDAVRRLASLPDIRDAAGRGAALTSLWPLTDAMMMGNDAKYAENLQVRESLVIAHVLTGLDVTRADAEYVYEGAYTIPGRPQDIVDALLAANDACDAAAAYRGKADSTVFAGVAQALGASWNAEIAGDIADIVRRASQFAADNVVARDGADDAGNTSGAAESGTASEALRVAGDLAVYTLAAAAMLRQSDAAQAGTAGACAVLLALNEWCDSVSLPRLFYSQQLLSQLMDAREANGDGVSDAFVSVIAQAAGAEWEQHRGDVLWDPKEAKRQAKEADERRNKAELSAKFSK